MKGIKKLVIKTNGIDYELINNGTGETVDLSEYAKKTDIPIPDNDTLIEEEGILKAKQLKVDNTTIEEAEGIISLSSSITDELTRLAEEAEKNKSVTISQAENNAIETKEDGIYVAKQVSTEINISTDENNILENKEDGLYVPKQNEVLISPEEGNIIEKKADGLYASNTPPDGLVPFDLSLIPTTTQLEEFNNITNRSNFVKLDNLTLVDMSVFALKSEVAALASSGGNNGSVNIDAILI